LLKTGKNKSKFRDFGIGILTQGNLADLIVVDGSPLKDIIMLQNQLKIYIVMKDGSNISKSSGIISFSEGPCGSLF
jgi:hypothetical protein